MRHWPKDIVEDLRLTAEMDAIELGEPKTDILEYDAADYIDHLRGALQRIADGDPKPAKVATEALDDRKWARANGPLADLP